MKNLKTLSFSVSINADREKVWEVLWDPESYMQWTKVFCEGSRYEGLLKEGEIVKFLASDEGGMTSLVDKLVKPEQMVFIHKKELKDGVEKSFDWEGAKEIYYLKEGVVNQTELQVVVDIGADMEDYFQKTFKEALQIIKEISETA